MTAVDDPSSIAERLQGVRENIDRAARRVRRDPSSIRLIVVTKGVPVDRVERAVVAGARDIGENRLQEALPKIGVVGSRYGDLHWHFIGTLQRRKVKSVVGTFELIQSVDSVPLAADINRRAEARSLRQRVLLEVNLAQEPAKSGFSPGDVARAIPTLDRMAGLQIEGVMAIPPYSPDPEDARPYFRRLRELAQSLRSSQLERASLDELSMGMSQDYEIAVEEGATIVRVGRAIFGARHA